MQTKQSDDLHSDPGLGPGLYQQKPEPLTRPATPEGRSTEFVAVEGGGETTSAGTLLVAAYLVMWAMLFGFVLLGWRRQHRLDRRVAELEKSISAAERKA